MDETKLRAEFEAWVRRTVTDVTEHDLERDGEIYEWDRLNMAFAAWKASREAVVVDMPEKISEHNKDARGYVNPAAAEYDEAIDDCRAAIHAAGIRTK